MKTLLTGYRAADLDKRFLAECGEVTCHVLDIYHRHAIEKTHHVKAICSPHLPDGEWDAIKYRTGPKLMSGELALDMLQECRRLSEKCGARLDIDYAGRERDRNSLLEKVFGKGARERSFAAHYTASVPGARAIELVSVPGCFCHRRTDEGGLALAEVAVRELSAAGPQAGVRRFLDMGCGNGLVGLLVASALPGIELVMVDSHSRAIEAAAMNAKALWIAAETILADNGTPERMDATFDVFVGNPPYYSEYRIAEIFYETAKRALKPGGVCYMVCKNAAGLEPVARNFFTRVEIVRRRGYSVLRSVKDD